MNNAQVRAAHDLKYRKVINIAKLTFDACMVEPETDIMVYDYYPERWVEAVTLAEKVVYKLVMTYDTEGIFLIQMRQYPFRGFGRNGCLIINFSFKKELKENQFNLEQINDNNLMIIKDSKFDGDEFWLDGVRFVTKNGYGVDLDEVDLDGDIRYILDR